MIKVSADDKHLNEKLKASELFTFLHICLDPKSITSSVYNSVCLCFGIILMSLNILKLFEEFLPLFFVIYQML